MMIEHCSEIATNGQVATLLATMMGQERVCRHKMANRQNRHYWFFLLFFSSVIIRPGMYVPPLPKPRPEMGFVVRVEES